MPQTDSEESPSASVHDSQRGKPSQRIRPPPFSPIQIDPSRSSSAQCTELMVSPRRVDLDRAERPFAVLERTVHGTDGQPARLSNDVPSRCGLPGEPSQRGNPQLAVPAEEEVAPFVGRQAAIPAEEAGFSFRKFDEPRRAASP